MGNPTCAVFLADALGIGRKAVLPPTITGPNNAMPVNYRLLKMMFFDMFLGPCIESLIGNWAELNQMVSGSR
jgi:hypothetical protein